MSADLHCHTRISDGSTGIDELVEIAKNKGLTTIAITDHDTFAGVTRGQVHGKKVGVEVLHGAEISAFDYTRGRLVHVLCYLCESPDRLEGLFQKTAENRRQAMNLALHKIMKIYPITAQMVAKRAVGSTTVFKSHIMQALMDAGYTDKVYGQLYQKLFNWRLGIARTKIEYPDVFEILELIHQAGGVAVLAHPGVYNSLELLPELAKKGLSGVECWYPRATEEEISRFVEIADAYDLIKIGGTDFHGCNSTGVHPLGTCTTPPDQLQRLKAKKTKAKIKLSV
ncbi:phosphatase [Clostridia bacterium]|nr:phosphatase [Clostridia bacterium]